VRRGRMRRTSCGALMRLMRKSPGEGAPACSATRIGSGAQRRPLCRRCGSLSTSTARSRRRRKRQKAGTRVVMFEMHFDDLDGLEALGQIIDADELDQRTLSAAVADFLTYAIRRDCREATRCMGDLSHGVVCPANDSEDG